MAKKKSAGCEYCSNYVYDEDYEYYVCDINLDEDEMARFMSYSDWDCPYSRWTMNMRSLGNKIKR